MELIIIDPQIDFCDPEKGTLYVPGAENDIQNISKFIDKLGKKIQKIYISLDLHHPISIFHPLMWIDNKKEHPAPFTVIKDSDIKDNIWNPIFPELRIKYRAYCKGLEKIKKHKLTIWPEHCLIGSEGSNVVSVLYNSILKWQRKVNNNINWVIKGASIHTENYSIIKAEIPDKNEPSTLLNKELLKQTEQVEQILIRGEAGSHCVLESIKDIVKYSKNKKIIENIIFLENCISPVKGFENIQENFIKEYKELRMKVTKTTNFYNNKYIFSRKKINKLKF